MSVFPKFERGALLNSVMLDALRDTPEQTTEILFSPYADGILCGFNVNVQENEILVSPGLWKKDGKLYSMTETQHLPVMDGKVYCSLSLNEEEKDNCVFFNVTAVQLNEPAQWEIFRYVHSEGAALNNPCSSFSAMCGDYPRNTINITMRECTVIGGNIPDDTIFKAYASEMLLNKNNNAEDVAFAYQCMNGIQNISVIKHYLSENGDLSNKEILQGLYKKLNSIPQKKVQAADSHTVPPKMKIM